MNRKFNKLIKLLIIFNKNKNIKIKHNWLRLNLHQLNFCHQEHCIR